MKLKMKPKHRFTTTHAGESAAQRLADVEGMLGMLQAMSRGDLPTPPSLLRFGRVAFDATIVEGERFRSELITSHANLSAGVNTHQ